MSKILFINPSLRLNSKNKFLPVGIATIMSYFKQNNISFDFLDVDIDDLSDDKITEFLSKNHYDIFLSGSIVTHYKWMKWLTNQIRQYNNNAKIIVGNSVAGSIPEVFLGNSEADIAVIGEGELTSLEVVQKILAGENDWEQVEGIAFKDKNGKVTVNPRRSAVKKLDDFPMIDWSNFNTEKYFQNSYAFAHAIDDKKVRIMPITTARGCAFKCTFCHFVFWNDPYRYRSPESIIKELARNIEKYNCNYVSFWDDLSFASLAQAERLADAIIASGLTFKWNAAVRVDLFGNPKHSKERRLTVAKKFKDAGCMDLGFSLESANAQILEMMNKKISAEYFIEQVRILEEAGISSSISVVFGYPIETPETIKETFELCFKAKLYPSIGYLLPLPSTGMYEYAKKHGYIQDEDKYLDSITERQDLCLNMTKMADDQVKDLIAQGAEDLNSRLKLGLTNKSLIKTGGYNNHTKSSKMKKLTRDKNSLILNYGDAQFEANLGTSN